MYFDRKDLKRPDVFVQQSSIIFTWINQNSKLLVSLGVLVIAGLGVYFGYSSYQSRKSEQASVAVFIAQKSLNTAIEKLAKTDPDWEKKTSPDKLEKTAKEFVGTTAAFEAFMLLGDLYFDHSNYTKALGFYKEAAQSVHNRFFKSLAYYSAGYTQENLKQYDGALDSFQQVINFAAKGLKGDTLMAMARVYQLKGDSQKAMEKLNQITTDFPNTALAKSAEIQKHQQQGKK